MVERKTLVSVLLIVVLVSVSSYSVGRFSTLKERVTTTLTFTTTVVREPPQVLPPPANSIAIMKGRLALNGSVSLMLSLDKPVYSVGEVIHFKSTVTNLTPRNISLDFDVNVIWIVNSTGERVWMYPEHKFRIPHDPWTEGLWLGLGPYGSAGVVSLWKYRQCLTLENDEIISIDSAAFYFGDRCSLSIDDATIDWNTTGLHRAIVKVSGNSVSRVFYDNHPVPEGQYTLVWEPSLRLDGYKETISETISFTITK